MLKKPNNWESVEAYSGGFPKLPVDGYIIKIEDVKIKTSDRGFEYLEILFDISEGKYKDYFHKEYDANDFDNAKYKGVFRQGTPKNSDRAASFFKGMVTAIEDSNPGYKWDWDEKSIVGKSAGCIFRSEEWEYNGKTGFRTTPFRIVAADKIRSGDYTVPEPKTLPAPALTSGNSLSDFDKISDDDIPF